MYEAILTAMRDATNEASAKGWQGYELQAHVFLAAFTAATKGITPAEPDAEVKAMGESVPDPIDPAPVPMVTIDPPKENVTEIVGVNSDNGSA
jgi:hypothetical protein